MANLELEVVLVFFFGPIAALALSIGVSSFAERNIQGSQRPTPLHAAATASGAYGLILGVLFLATRNYGAGTPQLLGQLQLLTTLTGLPYVGPMPLVAWTLVAGVVHGLWRP